MRRNSGFTLIELLVTIGIISVLVSIGAVAYTKAQSSARDAKRRADLEDLRKALFSYQLDNGTFCLYGKGNCIPFVLVANAPVYEPGSSALLDSYLKSIPRDPALTGNRGGYVIQHFGDDLFSITASLENASASNLYCTPFTNDGKSRNYCISEGNTKY